MNGYYCLTCKDGYYSDITTDSCLKCDSSCLRCSGPTEDDCSDCPITKYKYYPYSDDTDYSDYQDYAYP